MSSIQSISCIAISYGFLFLLGLGITLHCFPAKIRHYSIYIAPAIGYISFCFLSIWLSGLTNAAVTTTNLLAFLGLSTLTVTAMFQYRTDVRELFRSASALPLLLSVMLVVVFTPVFLQGVDLYIGTANPDFYQSLSFHEALVRFKAKFWIDQTTLPLDDPFLGMFPVALQARFGGVAFSILLEQILGISSRGALTTSIVVFLLCLPGTVYFFSHSVLEFSKRAALLSAILVTVAAPTTMSFVHTLVGQNSALATFPLAIALIYLALKERSISLTILTAIVLNGIFWLYVMVLPYVLAPFGLYVAIKFVENKGRGFSRWFFTFGVIAALSVAVHLSVFGDTFKFLDNLAQLLSKLTQSHYYADFLTEEVLQYAIGLTSYPLSQSVFFHSINRLSAIVLLVISISLVIAYFWAIRLWSKTASRDASLIILSLIITYVLVWFKYTFLTRYGYASFKMSAWLQFLVAPFFAWYILENWQIIRNGSQNIQRWKSYFLLVLLIPVYVGLNLASDLDYGLKSFGDDRLHGSLINSYGIAGNRDFVDLPKSLESLVPAESTIAMGFGDSIENFWAAYYARKSVAEVTILTHEEIPFEDAWLPDIQSRKYTDSLGQTQIDTQRYFKNGVADYYLLPGSKNLNTDIIDSKVAGVALWSNDTFALYKKGDLKDLISVGRGFYRVEHMDSGKLSWWWPETFRWSSQGGEIYHLMPSLPGQPYRVELSAISGLGRSSGLRTIEFWHNGTIFDEVLVDGASRIVSRPYFPVDGVNRLVLRVKEKAVLTPRNMGLWNRDLPRRSTPINMLFSNVRLTSDLQDLSVPFPVNEVVEVKVLFAKLKTFNGFDVDGWIKEKSTFTAKVPPNTKRLILEILVPGNLEFPFPYGVEFSIDGVSVGKMFESAGNHTVEFDLPVIRSSEYLQVNINPQMAKRIADGMSQREVLQSIRLSSLKFSTH